VKKGGRRGGKNKLGGGKERWQDENIKRKILGGEGKAVSGQRSFRKKKGGRRKRMWGRGRRKEGESDIAWGRKLILTETSSHAL